MLPSLAKYVAEGVEVMIATCTGGERGDVLNPKLKNPENEKQLAEIRNQDLNIYLSALHSHRQTLLFRGIGCDRDVDTHRFRHR